MLQAIASAIGRGRGPCTVVSLIQGPPGTGKTAVICGILAALLHGNEFKGPAPAGPPAATGQGLQLDRIPTRRVLVCAQSNAAIDELLCRLSAEVWPPAVTLLTVGLLGSVICVVRTQELPRDICTFSPNNGYPGESNCCIKYGGCYSRPDTFSCAQSYFEELGMRHPKGPEILLRMI
jgi:hypothetical protein